MKIQKEEVIKKICEIRDDIGHKEVRPDIIDILFSESTGNMIIITSDRPEKSVVIGKGGWVVGKLKEELNINSIHVEAYSDILLRKYRTNLSLNRINDILKSKTFENPMPLENLGKLLKSRIENIYDFEAVFQEYRNKINESKEHQAVVALSGGVDSSFSLIIAKVMGFNPIAVTVNPGSIILPKYFQESVEKLCKCLEVEHKYIYVDIDAVIKGSLEGKFHPCGRCSKVIEETILGYTKENKIPFLIFGDLLSTGAQSILFDEEVVKINMPAMLSATKGEIKSLASKFGVKKKGGYGCPLLGEVHNKYPHMKRFSIQRILRETRAGALEPGEALDQIMSSFK